MIKTTVASITSDARERGFSMIELLIVMSVGIILLAVALPSLRAHRATYRTEDQALRVVDLMRRATQKAITERQRMRVEIDLTDREARLVDENGTTATTDDSTRMRVTLDADTDVRMNATTTNVSQPSNVATPPVALHTAATFESASGGHLVWSVYFQNDGTATTAAGDPVSRTLMFWQPKDAADEAWIAKDEKLVRAITITGGAGAVRYWKYDGTTFKRG